MPSTAESTSPVLHGVGPARLGTPARAIIVIVSMALLALGCSRPERAETADITPQPDSGQDDVVSADGAADDGTQAEQDLVAVNDAMAQTPDTRVSKLTYLALGDSYTIGEGVAPAERWPVQLHALLEAAGTGMASPEIIARTGWTTRNLLQAMDEATLEERYDLVSLLIGVNNQYQGRSPDEYRVEFVELLERALALAGGDATRVVVVSIPDWGASPFAGGRDTEGIAAEIDAFNAIGREETTARNVAWVDITPYSRDEASSTDFFAGDGLHPSGTQYAGWAERVMTVIGPGFEP